METSEVSRRLLGHKFPGRFPDIPESGPWAIVRHHETRADGFDVPGLGRVRVVEHSHNQTYDPDVQPGMHLVVLIVFADHRVGYYRINGYWDSWDCRWDGKLYPVTKRLETVTIYEPVNPEAQQ
jgi:hypothetical protein